MTVTTLNEVTKDGNELPPSQADMAGVTIGSWRSPGALLAANPLTTKGGKRGENGSDKKIVAGEKQNKHLPTYKEREKGPINLK